jgi:hypothetical protein
MRHAAPRAADEFNRACAHFCRLLGAAFDVVIQVDVYKSDITHRAFSATKEEFRRLDKSTEEVWVFHGTNDINIGSIMATGLKFGGQNGIHVANGSSFGKGVYTASGPSAPLTYAKRGNKVILARALKGRGGNAGVGDSWEPYTDWIVFRHGGQLLPVYVVHYRAL